MTELRLVSPDDTTAVRDLWQYCFADEEHFAQWYFQSYYKPENTLGVYEGKRLLAATQVIGYTIMLRDKPFEAGYVVGVSTSPDARRQGLGREMLAGALQLMHRRGQGISLLMPFEGDFYYRYQWQFAYFKQQLTLPIQELRGLARSFGEPRLVDAQKHLSELEQVYANFCRGRNGYVRRTAENWQRLLSDVHLQQGYCCVLYAEEEPVGYAFYTLQDKAIQVVEMAYSHYQACCGLLDYFYGHRSHCQTFSWAAPADEALPYELPKSKDVLTLYPYLMLRVVDAEQVLAALNYPKELSMTLRLKLTDNLADWNNGIFALTIDQGKAAVMRQTGSDWDMTMDIGALSLLVSGSADCRQLLWRGLLTAADEAILDKGRLLWPKQNNWINEDY